MSEVILIVDDEESVRRTFREWLTGSGLNIEVHSVADAESALLFANEHHVDLAVLDWNLGTGSDGLKLLEDLVEFHPDIVAILVTGFAHQATPLEALRMGVRDYLDKNQDLNRETFLTAIQKQLQKIIPAKRQRQFTQGLLQFREAVDSILPLVQSTQALNDPVPLPDAVRNLFRFMIRTTQATDGVLLARSFLPDGTERFIGFTPEGKQLPALTLPFNQTLASTVLSLGEPSTMTSSDLANPGTLALHSFEQNRTNLLAAPISVTSSVKVILELFDKPTEFTSEDRKFVANAAEFCGELLRQALAERQSQKMLIQAVEAALIASERMTDTLASDTTAPSKLPTDVIDCLKQNLSESGNTSIDPQLSLHLAETIRDLSIRHGSIAVKHCSQIIDSVKNMLDEQSGNMDG